MSIPINNIVGTIPVQIIVGKAQTPAGIPLPPGRIERIKHDHEAKDGKQRIGYPEVYPLRLSQYCDLTEAWQWFWFRQLVHSYTNFVHWDERRLSPAELKMLKGKWKSLTKSSEAFTNFRGTNENADYINGVGQGMAGQEPLTCCGNIVKALGSSGAFTRIETLDGNRPPPPIDKVNRLLAPHVIFGATNVAAWKDDRNNRFPFLLPDGSYRVDPFPQLAPRDTLVPLRTNGKEAVTYQRNGVWWAENFILSSRLVPVTPTTGQAGAVVPSPYNPPYS